MSQNHFAQVLIEFIGSLTPVNINLEVILLAKIRFILEITDLIKQN